DLAHLSPDLGSGATLPAISFVEPDTCHDGHDTQSLGGCTLDPEGPTYPSGVGAINAWLPGFVQQVTHSPSWDDHSLLFITFDEAAATDTSGCAPCHDTSAGGRIGALAISPMLTAGGTSSWQGDHYSFLRTLEAAWGLPTLKSRAADAAAAAKVHDGDPGVTVLGDIWVTPAASSVTTAPSPAPRRGLSPGRTWPPTGGTGTAAWPASPCWRSRSCCGEEHERGASAVEAEAGLVLGGPPPRRRRAVVVLPVVRRVLDEGDDARRHEARRPHRRARARHLGDLDHAPAGGDLDPPARLGRLDVERLRAAAADVHEHLDPVALHRGSW